MLAVSAFCTVLVAAVVTLPVVFHLCAPWWLAIALPVGIMCGAIGHYLAEWTAPHGTQSERAARPRIDPPLAKLEPRLSAPEHPARLLPEPALRALELTLPAPNLPEHLPKVAAIVARPAARARNPWSRR